MNNNKTNNNNSDLNNFLDNLASQKNNNEVFLECGEIHQENQQYQ
jgi:hypothetical protein